MKRLAISACHCAFPRLGRCRARGRADRPQIQPCGGAGRAQGQGGAVLQGTGREIHRRPRQGRSLSELLALQGQRGTRGAAARLGAVAGAVDVEVQPARRQGVRRFRFAVSVERRGARPADDGEPDDGRTQQEAREQGGCAARLLGQWRARLHRQQAADHAGRFSRHENAHPGRQGAGCGGARARRHSADHRLRRALSGAADRRGRRRGQRSDEYSDPTVLRSAEAPDHLAPRPADLRARDQQDLLECAAAGCARPARSRGERIRRISSTPPRPRTTRTRSRRSRPRARPKFMSSPRRKRRLGSTN